jgi:hypothetical protein
MSEQYPPRNVEPQFMKKGRPAGGPSIVTSGELLT